MRNPPVALTRLRQFSPVLDRFLPMWGFGPVLGDNENRPSTPLIARRRYQLRRNPPVAVIPSASSPIV